MKMVLFSCMWMVFSPLAKQQSLVSMLSFQEASRAIHKDVVLDGDDEQLLESSWAAGREEHGRVFFW